MKLKAKRPFGLKFEIFDPEDGSLLGGGSNRALVSKNASAGIKRATTTDPAALSLGAVREGGIEGKYRVSIFQGNQPLTHESFRSKKNAIAYAVDWKERKKRNIYGFSAKLRLREFGQPISATKKLLRWLYPDGRRKVSRESMAIFGGNALKKNQGTYTPYSPNPAHHHIAIGKGSDLNVLWHEAGHHADHKNIYRKEQLSGRPITGGTHSGFIRWLKKEDPQMYRIGRKFAYKRLRGLSAKLRLRELAYGRAS